MDCQVLRIECEFESDVPSISMRKFAARFVCATSIQHRHCVPRVCTEASSPRGFEGVLCELQERIIFKRFSS